MNAMAMQRPPPFQKENLVVWFGLLEAAMNLSKLTSDATRYYYGLSALDTATANLIAGVIMSPPPVDKYKTVKERLMKLFGQSEEARARELLSTCRMGDEKPSHFLQRLRGLAGSNVPDSLLKSIFLEQVPSSLHDILVASENPDLNKLAALADRVTEFRSPHVSSMERDNMAVRESNRTARADSMATREDHADTSNTTIVRQLAELTKRFDRMEAGQSSQRSGSPRWRSNQRDRRPRSRSRSRSAERNSGVCYYHRKFGARANRCIIPCAWTQATPGNHNTASTPAEN